MRLAQSVFDLHATLAGRRQPALRNTPISSPSLKDSSLIATELADAVAEADDISKAKAKEVVNSVFATIIEAAKRGEQVAINGFGCFSVIERPAREGRNPATGALLKLPASKSIALAPCPSTDSRVRVFSPNVNRCELGRRSRRIRLETDESIAAIF